MTRRALRGLALIFAGLVLAATLATGTSPPAGAAPPGSTTVTTVAADPCARADRPCWEAHLHRRALERAWWAERVRQQERERADRIWRANLERLVAHLRAQAAYPSGQCGGRLPSCRVLDRESDGDLRIWNGRCYAPYGWRGAVAPNCPRAQSSASGKWQMVRRTWNYCRTGYVNAADAPERVQDDCAAIIKRVQPTAWN